jgi:hypothetical protein
MKVLLVDDHVLGGFMRIQRLALLAALCLVSAHDPLGAQPSEKPTWRLKIDRQDSVLAYGSDNEEDTPIAFLCKAGSGVVRVLIGETSEAVKPDQAATASLTAGSVTAKVRGKTTPNEEAGVPSFSGTLPASDRLLAALSKAPLLVFTVGPSRQQVPLAEIGDKGSRLIGQCAKR